MPIALLLAMQAAGMIVDWLGTQEQQRIANMGAKIQQAGIEANIQQTRLEAEDESVQALINLRKQLGAQAAIFAARGTAQGAGNSVLFTQESISDYKSDERMRRMNLLGRENELKAGGLISKLNQQGQNTKLWQGFAQRSMNRIPTSQQAWGQMGKNFGMTQLGS